MLSGEIALKNNHYNYYYYIILLLYHIIISCNITISYKHLYKNKYICIIVIYSIGHLVLRLREHLWKLNTPAIFQNTFCFYT